MTTLKSMPSQEKHERLREALARVVLKEHGDLSPAESIAVVAGFLGGLVALQSQMGIQEANAVVAENLKRGNLEAIASMRALAEAPPKGRA